MITMLEEMTYTEDDPMDINALTAVSEVYDDLKDMGFKEIKTFPST